MSNDYKDYSSKNLKYLRTLNNDTASDVAKIIGKTPNAIYNYESGIRSMGVEEAYLIARHYNINLDDFLVKDLIFEAAKTANNNQEITAKEFSNEVKVLLLKTGKLTNAQKKHIISTLDLICEEGGDDNEQ